MSDKLRANIRSKLVEEGQQSLSRWSLRMRLAGAGVRRDFTDAFIEWKTGDGQTTYEQCCREYGISPALIWLLIEVAVKILIYWWEHRSV